MTRPDRDIAVSSPEADPVLHQRARADRLASLGRRIGWGAIAVAVAAFFVGVATGDFSSPGTLVVAALVVATLTLAPGIVLGYAVKAAEREDAPTRPH